MFLNYCNESEDDELREACIQVNFILQLTFIIKNFQSFEAFISRCTKDVTPFIDEILGITTKLIQHDPNYHYDDNEENGMEVDS